MFEGFGPEKMLFLMVVLLLVFGAKRIPEIGSSLGKGIREFKKSMNQITEEPEPKLPPTQSAPQLSQPTRPDESAS